MESSISGAPTRSLSVLDVNHRNVAFHLQALGVYWDDNSAVRMTVGPRAMIQMDLRWEKGINEAGQEVRVSDLVQGIASEEGWTF